ncbi:MULTISPECIES: stage II sporulation protein R [Alteribacter]|uniref:Stage II sporulation protein R n=1 Tax=Alteribacter keqinensis TaxID=2483800 RepID=A0A3M7TQI0_9BACI|nr:MULTISPECIES: stage II sporulation protein R [Alteribacter]MBM7095573.1 stage II sporulation protein R [Alteribacter salitolerans]RNA67828.1 stage II sporulation protein R [Alteribacter keqinensis]
MKQRALIYTIISFLVLIMSWEGQQVNPAYANDPDAIPEESIRLRILANSNSPVDQLVKRNIRDAINVQITEWVQEIVSLEEARNTIEEGLPELEAIVASELEAAGSSENFTVSYEDVQFPTKLYGNFLYPAGEYEAVLVSIGEGRGDNWWCVLFPPLCFLDFGNGDAVAAETAEEDAEGEEEEVEVTFFFVEFFGGLKDRIFG